MSKITRVLLGSMLVATAWCDVCPQRCSLPGWTCDERGGCYNGAGVLVNLTVGDCIHEGGCHLFDRRARCNKTNYRVWQEGCRPCRRGLVESRGECRVACAGRAWHINVSGQCVLDNHPWALLAIFTLSFGVCVPFCLFCACPLEAAT